MAIVLPSPHYNHLFSKAQKLELDTCLKGICHEYLNKRLFVRIVWLEEGFIIESFTEDASEELLIDFIADVATTVIEFLRNIKSSEISKKTLH